MPWTAGGMSDVTGYRSDAAVDGGALMKAVAPQLDSVLTGKLPLLNGPGMVIENSLYYDIASSTVTAVELQETFQKDRITLNNLSTTGGSASCYIPSVLFANTLFLNVELPPLTWSASYGMTDTTSGTPTGDDSYFFAPDGWGFFFVGSVIIYVGASTISQIEISGESNFLIAMAQCETRSKRQQVLSHAGRYLNSADSQSVMASPAPNLSVFRLNPRYPYASPFAYSSVLVTSGATTPLNPYDAEYPPLRNALIPIRLPFSSLCALEKRISFDCKLLTQPIQLTFQIRPRSQVIQTNVPGFQSTLNNFASASVQLWQEELSDKSLSLRNELLRAPDFNVGYPFQYTQSVSFPVPLAAGASSPWDSSNLVFMNITSLLNSDLTTMLWYITGNYQRNTAQATALANTAGVGGDGTAFTTSYNGADYTWIYGVELQNMELKLNGQRFYAFDKDSYAGATMAKQIDSETFFVQRPQIGQLRQQQQNADKYAFAQFFDGTAQQGATVVAPDMTSFVLPSHYYELNFGKLRSLVLEAHMQNTGRFTNQTFQLAFIIADLFACPQLPGFAAGGFGNGTISVSPWTLYMSYNYNAVFLVGGDGGTSKLITN